MNNNKSLSSLLITMLALYGANASAMENKVNPNILRGKSQGKPTKYNRTVRNFKLGKARSLLENPKFKRDRRQYIVQYAGPALDDFLSKYELDVNPRYTSVSKNYGLEGRTILSKLAAGNAGTVAKCRLKGTDRSFAVKCEPNPNTTGAVTVNNQTLHADDNENESRFYDESSRWWPNATWKTKKYDKFTDGNVSYTVTDWVEGQTLNRWFQNLSSIRTNPKAVLNSLADFLEEYNTIINDLTAHNRINSGMHEDNVMITENGKLKVVDNGRYRERRSGEDLEERNAQQIRRLLNLETNRPQWRWLWIYNELDKDDYKNSKRNWWVSYDRNSEHAKLARVFRAVNEALECINRQINSDGDIVMLPRRWRVNYSSDLRNRMPSILRAAANSIKN